MGKPRLTKLYYAYVTQPLRRRHATCLVKVGVLRWSSDAFQIEWGLVQTGGVNPMLEWIACDHLPMYLSTATQVLIVLID